MSEITFTDDAEREFWDITYAAMIKGASTQYATGQADLAVLERRKRIGTKPQPLPPSLPIATGSQLFYLPPEVQKVIEVDLDQLEAAGDAVIFRLADDIRAARRVLGLDKPAKEGT